MKPHEVVIGSSVILKGTSKIPNQIVKVIDKPLPGQVTIEIMSNTVGVSGSFTVYADDLETL